MLSSPLPFMSCQAQPFLSPFCPSERQHSSHVGQPLWWTSSCILVERPSLDRTPRPTALSLCRAHPSSPRWRATDMSVSLLIPSPCHLVMGHRSRARSLLTDAVPRPRFIQYKDTYTPIPPISVSNVHSLVLLAEPDKTSCGSAWGAPPLASRRPRISCASTTIDRADSPTPHSLL